FVHHTGSGSTLGTAMLLETLTVEVKRAPSGRWTVTGADERAEGESREEALSARAARLAQREASLARLRASVEAIWADAKEKGLDKLTEEEIAAEIRAVRQLHA